MPEMSRFEKRFVNRRSARAYQRVLARIEQAGQLPITSSSHVLELGAGNGALSIVIQERFHPAQIRVTDYDPEQLLVAKQNIEDHFGTVPPSMVVERGDAAHLGYADSSFDLVMAHHVLHHLGSVPEILRGLDEIARVLRPGGRLFYVEMFHKRQIREHLTERGFVFGYRERAWRIFNVADVVVAVSPGSKPATNGPTRFT
ncbi:MAG TPA: class I SAM-dependent methyltransferase [Thermoplasmata archaeon]|nr:class I SAM-dependent methyltransferase [Thermoplasmata archaeon]